MSLIPLCLNDTALTSLNGVPPPLPPSLQGPHSVQNMVPDTHRNLVWRRFSSIFLSNVGISRRIARAWGGGHETAGCSLRSSTVNSENKRKLDSLGSSQSYSLVAQQQTDSKVWRWHCPDHIWPQNSHFVIDWAVTIVLREVIKHLHKSPDTFPQTRWSQHEISKKLHKLVRRDSKWKYKELFLYK